MPDTNSTNTPQARLKKRYRDDNRIDRLLYPDHPLSIETCYIQLALIKEKDLKQSQANDLEKTTDLDRHYRLREYERIENIQEKIELEAIFTSCEKSPKRIYIEGATGTGKSTLSRRLAYEWGKDFAFFADYDWVFYIRLRDLTAKEYTEDKDGLIEVLAEQLLTGCSVQQKKVQKEVFSQAVFENANRVLWILDGYDELPSTIQDCSWWKDLRDSECHILMTSRPDYQVHSDLRINLRLAVLGFSDKQIDSYVGDFFNPQITPEIDPEQRGLFLEYIKADLNLWSLAHTPIQLELLCSVWDKGLEQKENITLTNLYSLIINELFKWPKTKNPKVIVFNLAPEDLEKEYETNLCCLEQLAYSGMQASEILFTTKNIQESYQTLKVKLSLVNKDDFIEKLKFLGLFKYYSHNGSGEFLHLTFQEYFAARHIAKMIQQSVEGNNTLHQAFESFFKENKFNPRLQIVWRFVAGLLREKNNTQALTYYFNLLLQTPRDIVVINELTLWIHCLEQSQLKDGSFEQIFLKKCYQQSLQILLLHGNYISLSRQLIYQLKACPLFLKKFIDSQFVPLFKENKVTVIKVLGLLGIVNQKIIEVLLIALKYKDNDVSRSAVYALNLLGEKAATLEVFAGLIEALKHNDSKVICSAADALGRLREKAATPEVITGLVEIALKHYDSEVNHHAAVALGLLREKVATPEVLAKLIEALKHNDGKVSRCAAEVLGCLGEKAATPEVITCLIESMLKHNDNEVSHRAAEALGRLGEKAITAEVLAELVKALKHKDNHASYRAAEVLGRLGEKAATSKVLTELVETLKHNDSKLSLRAAEALGCLGKKAAIPEVLAGLIEALKHRDSDVSHRASEALIHLGEKAATPEVLTELVEMLKHNDSKVSCRAANMLSFFGEKAATPEVIAELVEIMLKHHNIDVSFSAANTLSRLGEKAITPEMIAGLVKLFKHKDSHVSRRAANVLGRLGEKAATPEVLTALIETLKHNDIYRIGSAVDTLGRLGEKAATLEVIAGLVEALKHNDSAVNFIAPYGLSHLGEKIVTKKIILNKLIPSLLAIIPSTKKELIRGGHLDVFFTLTKYCPLLIESNQLIFCFPREEPFTIRLRDQELQSLKNLLQKFLGVSNLEIIEDKKANTATNSSDLNKSIQQGGLMKEIIEKILKQAKNYKNTVSFDRRILLEIYGFALALSRLSMDEHSKNIIENKLIKNIKEFIWQDIQPSKLLFNTFAERFDAFKDRLEELRFIPREKKSLQAYLQEIQAGFEDLLSDMVKYVHRLLGGEAPCPYALLSLGSFATGLVTPHSDIEYVILVANHEDLAKGRNYLSNFADLFDLLIIAFGESPIYKAETQLKACFKDQAEWEQYRQLVCKGLRLDEHKRPQAINRQFDLINTPQGLLDKLAESIGKKSNNHLITSLFTTRLLGKDSTPAIHADYQRLLMAYLPSLEYTDCLKYLLDEDIGLCKGMIAKFNKALRNKSVLEINLKKQILIYVVHLARELLIFLKCCGKNIEFKQNPFEVLVELKEKGYLSDQLYKDWYQLLIDMMTLRVELQTEKQRADAILPLLELDAKKPVKEITTVLSAIVKHLETLYEEYKDTVKPKLREIKESLPVNIPDQSIFPMRTSIQTFLPTSQVSSSYELKDKKLAEQLLEEELRQLPETLSRSTQALQLTKPRTDLATL